MVSGNTLDCTRTASPHCFGKSAKCHLKQNLPRSKPEEAKAKGETSQTGPASSTRARGEEIKAMEWKGEVRSEQQSLTKGREAEG